MEAETGHGRLLSGEIPGPNKDTHGRRWLSLLNNTSVKPLYRFACEMAALAL